MRRWVKSSHTWHHHQSERWRERQIRILNLIHAAIIIISSPKLKSVLCRVSHAHARDAEIFKRNFQMPRENMTINKFFFLDVSLYTLSNLDFCLCVHTTTSAATEWEEIKYGKEKRNEATRRESYILYFEGRFVECSSSNCVSVECFFFLFLHLFHFNFFLVM